MKLATTDIYLAGGAEFLDPMIHTPPVGCKILLLTPGGVCVIGHWSNWFVGWHPLPTIPASVHERMLEQLCPGIQ